MNRVAEVNKALKEMGRAERLRRGKGYYYFSGGEAEGWYSASVMIWPRADAFSVERWLEEFEALKADAEQRMLGR